MANQFPSPTFLDGGLDWTNGGSGNADWTVAQPVSIPRFSSPIPATTKEYTFEQDFQQLRANFSALALNTPHFSAGMTPDYSAFLLVNEGPRQDIGGGAVRWTRTYAKVPDSYFEPEPFAYTFIGSAVPWPGNVVVRGRHTNLVTSRIVHDFFLVDPTLSADAPPIYKSEYNIPRILGMVYCTQYTSGGTTYGGIWAAADELLDPTVNVFGTFPTPSQYQAMVADAVNNGWNATITQIITNQTTVLGIPTTLVDTSLTVRGGILPAENSRLNRWRGNIFERQTRYILAE